MIMQMAKNGVSSLTSSWTSASLENKAGNPLRVMSRSMEKRQPKIKADDTAISNENLAVLG